MIVIGADTHKQSHTVGAVDAPTGRLIPSGPSRRGAARLMTF